MFISTAVAIGTRSALLPHAADAVRRGGSLASCLFPGEIIAVCFTKALLENAVNDVMEPLVGPSCVILRYQVILEQNFFEGIALVKLLAIEKFQPIIIWHFSESGEAAIPVSLECAQIAISKGDCLQVAVVTHSTGSVGDGEVAVDVPQLLPALHILFLGSELFLDDSNLASQVTGEYPAKASRKLCIECPEMSGFGQGIRRLSIIDAADPNESGIGVRGCTRDDCSDSASPTTETSGSR